MFVFSISSLQTLELRRHPFKAFIFRKFPNQTFKFRFLKILPNIWNLNYVAPTIWILNVLLPKILILHKILILPNIGLLIVHFHTLEFWPYPSKQFNSDLFPPNRGVVPFSFQILKFWIPFQTLELWPFPSKHWNSDLILPSTGIVTWLFQALECCLIHPNIGILNFARQRSRLLSFICR